MALLRVGVLACARAIFVSSATDGVATTTRTRGVSPGTEKALTILTGVSRALVSRLRSSRLGRRAFSMVSTALRASGRSTV